ncbi:metallophosphoesterase family protein [Roseibium sp.]|uniref:metallophosphoesterase family protein n=1 Tax=Roseibium sp. TaxID=1936156 RepID=UPI003A981172
MRLHAISDLHLSADNNRQAVLDLPDFGPDWLIVAGDVAERFKDIRFGIEELAKRFAKVLWVPGNHELWSIRRKNTQPPLRGVERYKALVDLVRDAGGLTPEDPFAVWGGQSHDAEPSPIVLAPLFLLYDYSFRPAHVAQEDVVRWAREHRTACGDQFYLKPDPHESREAWCAERLKLTEKRLSDALASLPEGARTVLINHYPLREELIRLPRAPRLTPWCGTRATHDWHTRFNALAAIYGHLHTRRTDHRDGTRFEEVSLGYPQQWDQSRGLAAYLRRIL